MVKIREIGGWNNLQPKDELKNKLILFKKQKILYFLTMKDNLIEVLDLAGTSAVCFQADSIENVGKLYDGQLLRITSKGLIDFSENSKDDPEAEEKYRFVLAKNPEERDVLLKVQPIRCYLRDHQMNSKVVDLNPYQSVRWLRNLIEKERNVPVTLIVNQQVLTQDSDSLLHHISQNCIIHILENQQPQKFLSTLYTKEPGSQSQIYKLENVSTQKTVDELMREISHLTTVPYENLLLVYGGRILAKDKNIAEYRLLSNGIIYAVDQRKYMKRVTKEQFQARKEEIRKSKEGYKELMKKIKSSPKKNEPAENLDSKINKQLDEGVKAQTRNREDSTRYFRDPVMKIESKQYEQFNKLDENLENKTAEKAPGEQEKKLGTPPNSPIYIFNRNESYRSVNSELKEGRVVTKETDVYEDPYGYVHEHSKQKTLFKNGRTKIVDVDIAEDGEGNIVKIEKDIVNIKKDSVTGNIIKMETDIIEDGSTKMIVKKQQIRDSEGNLIKQDTEVIKDESGKKQTRKTSRGIVKQGDNLVQVNTEILEDNLGDPYRIQTDIIETKQDEQGRINEHTKDIKQQNGVTTVIERNVMKDRQGNVVQLKTDIIKINEDQQGNIYKHERNEIDSINKTIVIERDIVTNPQGETISKETKMQVTQEDANSNVFKRETDVIEENDGRAVVIEKRTVEDAEGNIIKSQSEVFNLNREDLQEPQEVVILKEDPEAVQVEGQRQPLINGGKQVTIDELGNTHTHKKQLIEKQGKTTFVDRDTIQDARGKVIRVQTDIVEIEGQENGDMHKHKSEIVEQEGKVTMVETDQIVDIDGVLIRKELDTIQIQDGQNGSVIKHEKDIIEEEGKTKIIEKNIVEDADGNVIKSETKVTEIQDKENTIEVHEKQQLIETVPADQVEDNKEVQRQIEVVQDAEGNIMRREQKVTEDETGHRTFVDRCTFENAEGEIVREQTEVINVDESQQNPKVDRHLIDYSESDNKVVIEEVVSKENVDGSVIKAETQTLEIQKCEDGTIKKKETDVVEENGTKVIHVTNIVEDQQGKIISKTEDVVQLENIDKENIPLPLERQANEGEVENVEKVNIERTYNVDSEGNTHMIETETRNSAGHQTQIERQYITNPEGKIIKTETEIIDVQKLEDGTTKLSAVDISQEGNVTTVVENNEVTDANGNSIKTESGTLRIEELEGGIKKKDKENIIEVDGIRVSVEKHTYEDAEGRIIEQKTKTTQLVDKLDPLGNNEVVAEGFKRKEEEIKQDEEGNYHFHERQIIDNDEGRTSVVESEVVRSPDNELIIATTDVVEMTKLQDGTVARHEVNIVEEPHKVVVAETNALENAEGQRLQGQVQSVVITEGENGEIIKKQTGIVMEDFQKIIVEKTLIEDAEGNVLKNETTKKTIYTDENGVEKGRDSQIYKASQLQIGGEPSTLEKKINIDVDGNIETSERLTTIKGEGDQQVIEVVDVKVKQAEDGTIIDQSLDVTKIAKNEDGEVQITRENIPIEGNFDQYQQVESEIREPREQPSQENESERIDVQRQILEDEQGNLHTFQKQVIDKGEGAKRVITSEIVQNAEGQLININTKVADTEQLEEGRVLKHVTEIVEGEKVVQTETYTIENQDGSVLSERSRKIEVTENDGLVKTNRVDITKEQGRVIIDNLQVLKDEDGNVIEESSNRLEIQDTEQAVREQAKKVARAEINGEVTGIVKQQFEDQNQNIHKIETETIEDHGKRYIVDTETVQNKEGVMIRAETDLLEEQVLENGKVERHKTVITEEGGKVKVVEYSEIKEDEGQIRRLEKEKTQLENPAENSEVTITKVEPEQSAEELVNQPEVTITKVEEVPESGEVAVGLAYQPEVTITKVEEVPESGEVAVGLAYQPEIAICKVEPEQSVEGLAYQPEIAICKVEPPSTQAVVESSNQQDEIAQFYVTLVSQAGQQHEILVKEDDNMHEVAEKLSSIINEQNQHIKLHLNEKLMPEYQLVSDFPLQAGSKINFIIEK